MDVHFVAHRRPLNPFAYSGHLHNAKSVHIWSLTKEHPWLYQTYNDDGRHAVLRTDHPINELWTFEQVLVRSLKPVGWPLTQCRGMTESVRYQWVFIVYKRRQFTMQWPLQRANAETPRSNIKILALHAATGLFSKRGVNQYSPSIWPWNKWTALDFDRSCSGRWRWGEL